MIFQDLTLEELKFLQRSRFILQHVENLLMAQARGEAALSMRTPIVRSKLHAHVTAHLDNLDRVLAEHGVDGGS